MSIYVSTRTWDHSKASGAGLLMLLALADRSDEEGISWPGIAYLAQKARVTPRRIKQMLQEAEDAGELYIERSAGRKSTNRYFVVVGLDRRTIQQTLVKRFRMTSLEAQVIVDRLISHQKGAAEFTNTVEKGEADFTNNDEKGEIGDTKGETLDIKGEIQGKEKVKPASPDSSINPSINPSNDPRARAAPEWSASGVESLPFREIYDMPQLRIYRELTGRDPGELQCRRIVQVIRQIQAERKIPLSGLKEYLTPFWVTWSGDFGFRPQNLGWLTDWALAGEVPRRSSLRSTNNAPPKRETRIQRQLRELREQEGTG